MKRAATACFLLIALLALLAGCSNARLTAHRRIDAVRQTGSVSLARAYDKAVSDPRAGVVFALDKTGQGIDIFRGGIRVNSLGGLGFERTNFQRLSDIGTDTDGGLLALDSSLKVLRKFSPEGGIVSEQQLTSLRQPELFCMGLDGNLFVYDAASAEIVCYSGLDFAELYRFGRFQIDRPASLACNHDYLWVYSAARNQTDVFFLLGQYKETLEGQVIYDMFDNPIRSGDVHPLYSSLAPGPMSISSEQILMLFEREIRIYRIDYLRGPDETR